MKLALAVFWSVLMGLVGYKVGYNRGADVVGNRFMYEVVPALSGGATFTDRGFSIPRGSWPCVVYAGAAGKLDGPCSAVFYEESDMPDSVVVVYHRPE